MKRCVLFGLVVSCIIWLSSISPTIPATPRDYPRLPWRQPVHYTAVDYLRILRPSMPAFRRAEEFMLQTRRGRPVYPAAWNEVDRAEILLRTWIESRMIWQDPRARQAFDAPEGPFFYLLAQQAAESGFNRHARSQPNRDGSRDLGLTQQNNRYLARRGITDWRDIGQSVRAQARFMISLLRAASRHGGERARRAAAAGYTASPRWAARGVVPDIGRTRAHVAKIERFYQEMAGVVPAETPAEASGRVYIVQPGDTLWAIARRFGTTVEELARRNHIADPDLIRVGQELMI